MREKLSLEQFHQIKSQLQKLVQDYSEEREAHKNDENYNADIEEQKVIDEYLKIQDRLLQYDLSDIPFEAWEDMLIVSNDTHIADFSKTRANIDFNLVQYYGDGNFRGCNVRNLEKVKSHLHYKDFDEETIKANPSLFLSDSFSDEFKEKYYEKSINIRDLVVLSSEQLEEIKQKELEAHFDYSKDSNRLLVDALGIDKVVELYKYSVEDYETIKTLINLHNGLASREYDLPTYEDFVQQMRTTDVSELKNASFDYIKKRITNSDDYIWSSSEYPQSFVEENTDLFLVDANIPDEVKQRYFGRHLTIQDLLNYPNVFSSMQVDFFMTLDDTHKFFMDNYGIGKFQEMVYKHSDVFTHLLQVRDSYSFSQFLRKGRDADSAFTDAVKEYFLNSNNIEEYEIVNDGKVSYNLPDWLSSMNFNVVYKLYTAEDFMQLDDSTIVIQKDQRNLLTTLNIENIRQFDKETGFFTHKGREYSRGLEMFEALGHYITHISFMDENTIDFKNGNLSYGEFQSEIAKCLDNMRRRSVFTDYPPYDWIQGEFREKYPEIFLSNDAPDELKEAFYKNRITPAFLYNHKEYIKYLTDKNMSNTIRANMKLVISGAPDEQGQMKYRTTNFIDEYVSRYGNEKFLQLCAKYGGILYDVDIMSLNGEIDDEQLLDKAIKEAIYRRILEGNGDYSYLTSIPELVAEHPEIFINFDNLINISQEERQRLTTAFYTRALSFDDIKKYPELVSVLKDKNLSIAFGNKDGKHYDGRIFLDAGYGRTSEKKYSDLELLQVFGNEKFLQLCVKYGRYMDGIAQYLNKDITIRNGKYIDLGQGKIDFENGLDFEEISRRIESIIVRESKLGNIAYNSDDAPDFLKEKHPELFIDEDAPDALKRYFYNYSNNYPMTFEILEKHRDWLPFLKDKALATSLLRNRYLKKDLMRFFEVFGEEKAIKLGISRAETVTKMMEAHQVDLMKSWYDKTGGKFIPDFIVMQNFRLEEADKFLAAGANWSSLMRIPSFAKSPDARDAMLKLAYSFGAFDQDQRGFKKVLDLLTGLPRKLDVDKGYIIDRIDHQIDQYSQRGFFHKNRGVIGLNGEVTIETPNMTPEEKEEAYNKMIEHAKKSNFVDLIDTPTLVSLLESLKKEKVDIDFSKPIFAQLYQKNEDGTYSLTINPQSCQKSAQIVRGILEKFRELPIISPEKAHQLFGGFELKYDADFREFLLANMDEIMEDPNSIRFVSNIQRQFSEIKTINSNRFLTWELAVSFVQENKFTSVNPGNERVAEVSAIAGYSQADFDTLQQIYNYGKQRTFSSIPRIEQSVEKGSRKYTYEILRLDDPFAMAVGTLTDCCQALNHPAEVCMEHSMVDKNGRVFLIRDETGKPVAQSWVWRNQDVLCFDNIEIPDRAFARMVKEYPELGRKGFTDEVFEIYKKAAHELIEADEKVYRELLESGKITQEQYDGLRLGKVTVGLGNNDIRESLMRNAPIDKGRVSRPLHFEEPVKLTKSLYLSDSVTQYVLEERDDRKEYDGETLPVHSDVYIEYGDDNFTEKSLLSLERLELVTKEDPRGLTTSVDETADRKHLVTEISRNYGLNPETTKIIMNPNFAIIYDVNDEKIRIGELLFNTKVDNEQQQMDIEKAVIMQMRLAFDQIARDKEIDISALNDKQREMYAKITGLTDEMDRERGIAHAR